MEIPMVLKRASSSACHAAQMYILSLYFKGLSCGNSQYWVCVQGDGDYELVKDVEIDDYLRKRIAKVYIAFLEISLLRVLYLNARR